MQYVLIIYEDEAQYADAENGEAWQEVMKGHNAFAGELAEKGLLRGGVGLKTSSTSTTVRRDGGASTLHDGPYAETKEQLGGFYIIDAPDLDAALAWARKVPVLSKGFIEVRPALDM